MLWGFISIEMLIELGEVDELPRSELRGRGMQAENQR